MWVYIVAIITLGFMCRGALGKELPEKSPWMTGLIESERLIFEKGLDGAVLYMSSDIYPPISYMDGEVEGRWAAIEHHKSRGI